MNDTEPRIGHAVPLARLFAMAFRQLIDDLHERLAEEGWADMKRPYGFVLVAARDRPTSGKDIAALMGMTKQAASKLIDGMVEAGYVVRVVDPSDQRQKAVSLTSRGREVLAAVERIYAALEADWAEEIGADNLLNLRSQIAQVLITRNEGELPPVRPTW